MRDIYVIRYGTKYGYKYESGIVQKIFDTERKRFTPLQKAKQFESDVYIEGKYGQFKKLDDGEK